MVPKLKMAYLIDIAYLFLEVPASSEFKIVCSLLILLDRARVELEKKGRGEEVEQGKGNGARKGEGEWS